MKDGPERLSLPDRQNPTHGTACCTLFRLLLAKEKKEREEAERKKKELEEQLNQYTSQYENAQRGRFTVVALPSSLTRQFLYFVSLFAVRDFWLSFDLDYSLIEHR